MRKRQNFHGQCTENVRKYRKMWGKCEKNVRKSREIPYCQVSQTHERTPRSVDRDPIVIWRPANDRTFAIPDLYDIRKKQAVKHYPKTYENVSAYVSFHTFFWREWRFIPLIGFSNISWYYFIPHVDILHTFLFSYPLWQGFILPTTFIHTSSYFTLTQLHTRCTWVSYQDACSHCEHFTLTFCYFIPARVHTCSFSSSY